MTENDFQELGQTQGAVMGRRSATRLAAVQALYQIEMTDVAEDKVIAEFLAGDRPIPDGEDKEMPGMPAPEPELFASIVRGVVSQRDRLDESIGGALTVDWTVDRLEILVRLILEAGVYEISDRADIPNKVSINEYVSLSNAFFDGAEPGLVNAVLDAVAKAQAQAQA
jgi:N utilization substance protein B